MKRQRPPSKVANPGSAYVEEAAQLKAHPGEWYIIKTIPVEPGRDTGRSVAFEIKNGRYIVFRPAGSFEAESHRELDENGKLVLNTYARYVGKNGEYRDMDQ